MVEDKQLKDIRIGMCVRFVGSSNKLSEKQYSYWVPLDVAKDIFRYMHGEPCIEDCVIYLKNKYGSRMHSSPVVVMSFHLSPIVPRGIKAREVGGYSLCHSYDPDYIEKRIIPTGDAMEKFHHLVNLRSFPLSDEFLSQLKGKEEKETLQVGWRPSGTSRNEDGLLVEDGQRPKSEIGPEREARGRKNNMNMKSIFKGMSFGKLRDILGAERVGMTMLGLAVANKDKLVVYDKSKDEYVDATPFSMGRDSSMQDMIFGMPVALKGVKENDYIVHQGKVVRVVEVNSKTIKADDLNAEQVIEILPVKSAFGFDFVTKVVCPFADMFSANAMTADSDNPMGAMMPFLLMSQGGNGNNMMPMMMAMNQMNDGNMEDMFSDPMFMMFMMMGDSNNQSGNPYSNKNDMSSFMMAMFMSQMMNKKIKKEDKE